MHEAERVKRAPVLVIAFDQSSNVTGIALRMFDGRLIPGSNDTMIVGVLDHTVSDHIETRIASMYQTIEQLMLSYAAARDRGECVPVVVLEQARQGRFRSVYAALRCAQATVWIAAVNNGIPVRYVTPIQLRTSLGLSKSATKEDIRKAVISKLGSLETEDLQQDAIDAAAIAFAYIGGSYMKNRKILKLQ